MPSYYFAFEPTNRGSSKLAVKTPAGELEPVEPSRFKIFTNAIYHPTYSLLGGCLGLAVAILSYPIGFFVNSAAEGLLTKTVGDNFLPFRSPGLAVVVRKGSSLKQTDIQKLEDANFTVMMFASKTVWLKENAERDDYLLCVDMEELDPTGLAPARYLNVSSYESFLILRSFTTRVCELFHIIAEAGAPYVVARQCENSEGREGWINARNSPDADAPMVSTPFEFKSSDVYKMDGASDKGYTNFAMFSGSSSGTASVNPGALYSNPGERPSGILRTGQGANITKHGVLMKFIPQLASPDVQLIGDILGKRFLKGLGDGLMDQVENLNAIKTGLSALRLTRVGDELTHLYKCLDVAIDCNAGLIPIFEGERYEGSLIMGGPGATLIHNGRTFPFQSVTSLKNDFLNFSEHASNLSAIASLMTEEDAKAAILAAESMVDLRNVCLQSVLTQQDRDEIIRRAAHLDWGYESWVINPANIKAAMNLISNPSSLKNTDPIGRFSLFSMDPVVLGLSCFGEKSCPSWDVPNGTSCSLKKANPPVPPTIERKKGSRGDISDAAWVMVIRQTDLISAVEEFKEMANTLRYRSSSSALAKKVGHRVFSRDRMGEFWGDMRDALRKVNPNAMYEEGESSKRKMDEATPSTIQGDSPKRRRMGV